MVLKKTLSNKIKLRTSTKNNLNLKVQPGEKSITRQNVTEFQTNFLQTARRSSPFGLNDCSLMTPLQPQLIFNGA